MLHLFLMIVALVCFFIAAFRAYVTWKPWPTRVDLVALGLFCWALTLVI